MLNWTLHVHRDPTEWDGRTFPDLVVLKDSVTRAAVDIVEMCCSAAGGFFYYKRCPLERYYRDVRAGPIHPFQHPGTVSMLGKMAVPPELQKQ